MNNITSDKFNLIYEDLKRALHNSLVFGSPFILIILLEIQKGKSFEDIKLVVSGLVIQALIDLIMKFVETNKYSTKK